MIEKLSAATVRHRHVVLTLGLLLVGVNAAAPESASAVGQRLLFLLSLTALVLAAVVMGVRPASFVVQPRISAFATPGPAWTVFFALGYLGPASAHIGALLRACRQGTLSTFDVVLGVLWVLLGSLTVPWEAMLAPQAPPATDRRPWLPMRITEPELVRGRGIPRSRRALRTDVVDKGFLASAIGHYVAHPEHRAAIGGHAEYERLCAELPARG
ncbi:hypothetical protein [Micromonospora parva]|uniref:hypothetical protein n=1 Tax=Micromonospora parva TaxID=1464048 RepID=UPI0033C7ABAD